MEPFESIPDVLEVWEIAGPEAPAQGVPDLLIELPHGATKGVHLQRAKAHLRNYPGDRYDTFFYANTDQGSPEYGHHLAECLCNPAWVRKQRAHLPQAFVEALADRAAKLRILMIRSLLPRTVVDVNRVWELGHDFQAANLTGVIGGFMQDPDEIEAFHQRYRQYQDTVDRAFAWVCNHGGLVFNLHTYAPISVGVPKDADIVDVLEEAYRPENYSKFPRRPEVQLITTTPGGEMLAPAALCKELVARFEASGFEIKQDDPFNMHPAATCSQRAAQYPQRVVVLEISRKLLAEPFNPFVEMNIAANKVDRVVQPIALAFLAHLCTTLEADS